MALIATWKHKQDGLVDIIQKCEKQ